MEQKFWRALAQNWKLAAETHALLGEPEKAAVCRTKMRSCYAKQTWEDNRANATRAPLGALCTSQREFSLA